MSFPTEPAVPLPTWATDSGSIKIDPGATKRALGWEYAGVGLPYGEAPPFPWVNNELSNNGEWATYFKAVADYMKDNLPVAPTRQFLISGDTLYTLPTSPRKPLYIRIQMIGPGGGGAGSGTGAGNGTDGTFTQFGTNYAFGGKGAVGTTAGAGAGTSASNAFIIDGHYGQNGIVASGSTGVGAVSCAGGAGGAGGFFAGHGQGGTGITDASNLPQSGSTYGGGGGGGGIYTIGLSAGTNISSGGGGGAGGYLDKIIYNPADTYVISIGAGGTGGAAGTGGTTQPGGLGGYGVIFVTEHYQ